MIDFTFFRFKGDPIIYWNKCYLDPTSKLLSSIYPGFTSYRFNCYAPANEKQRARVEHEIWEAITHKDDMGEAISLLQTKCDVSTDAQGNKVDAKKLFVEADYIETLKKVCV
jgi:hypothetical protein